jgi:O-glycosyl hydrolase
LREITLSQGVDGIMTALRAVLISLAMLLCLAGLGRARSGEGVATIHVDPGKEYQRIDGFGVNYTGPYYRADQKAMFDMLIDDLGATQFRVVPYYVYSNWEVTNDNNDPDSMNWEYYNDRYSTPVFDATWAGLRYLNSKGIRPVIALMGPVPDWMMDDKVSPPTHKVCQPNVPAKLQGHLNPAMYGEFAEEVVSMVEYARIQAHIDFEYFSPFNETDCYPPEGPRIDPDEAPKVLDAVARRLNKEGMGDVRLVVPDNAVITNDYTDPILRDDDLMKQVGAFTFHTYGEDNVGPQVARVRASKYPNEPVWLTEYGDLNDEDKTFENQWKNFSLQSNRRALAALNQGASEIFYFDAFDDYEECARRLCFYGLFKSASHIYTPKKSYYATRQLYHFVRPGWVRIGATSDAAGLTVSAFRDTASKTIAIVGVKEGGRGHFRIDLPSAPDMPTNWKLYETTRELDCQKVGEPSTQSGIVDINLPAEAIFTLVGKVHADADPPQASRLGSIQGTTR